eukprot:365103-Chlamydomonas_euryale.AAC.5
MPPSPTTQQPSPTVSQFIPSTSATPQPAATPYCQALDGTRLGNQQASQADRTTRAVSAPPLRGGRTQRATAPVPPAPFPPPPPALGSPLPDPPCPAPFLSPLACRPMFRMRFEAPQTRPRLAYLAPTPRPQRPRARSRSARGAAGFRRRRRPGGREAPRHSGGRGVSVPASGTLEGRCVCCCPPSIPLRLRPPPRPLPVLPPPPTSPSRGTALRDHECGN